MWVRYTGTDIDIESPMVDENGQDRTYDYPDKQRNEMADKLKQLS